jgi:hypothetical protein
MLMQEHRYVIIGGATRAATTSLYIYFADHPEVCASNIKETRFFLDTDYPLPAKFHSEDGLENYETYFNHCPGFPLRLEATPDYLYSPGTPQKIKQSLPTVKIIFILREPIDRLISWYRFAKQTSRLSAQVSFEQYVYLQLKKDTCSGPAEQHMRSLEQGRYSTYLKNYFDLFERDHLCIVQYEQLQYDPVAFLEEICLWIGIDAGLYKNYHFKAFNRSQPMRNSSLHNVYVRFIRALQMRVHEKPKVRSVLRYLRRRLEPLYLQLNRSHDEQLVISDQIKKLLEDYYSEEPSKLAGLLGWKKFSWETPEVMAVQTKTQS